MYTTTSLKGKSFKNHITDRRQRVSALPNLQPGQDILFLLPENPSSHIKDTVIALVPRPRSYIIEHQECWYQCMRWHITTHKIAPFQNHNNQVTIHVPALSQMQKPQLQQQATNTPTISTFQYQSHLQKKNQWLQDSPHTITITYSHMITT